MDLVKAFGCLGQLQPDVFRTDEDGLEVHPLGLNLDPHLDHLSDSAHRLLPSRRVLDKGRDKLGCHHRGEVHRLVLENLCNLVCRAEHQPALLAALEVFDHREFHRPPRLGNLVDPALDVELLDGAQHDFANLGLKALEAHLEEHADGQLARVELDGHACLLHQPLPVPRPQGLILERGNERKRLAEAAHSLLHLAERAQRLDVLGHLPQPRLKLLHAMLEHTHVEL
mmetsp:Transcript_13831/g.40655  ORF Transcript_13831/g.40655 Transcript_13831/m.40655 type:complete len:227 (+) Transcript_13831:1118-1798(+)